MPVRLSRLLWSRYPIRWLAGCHARYCVVRGQRQVKLEGYIKSFIDEMLICTCLLAKSGKKNMAQLAMLLNWQCFSICPLLFDDRVNRNLTCWHPIIQFSINPCWRGVWLETPLHYCTNKTCLRGSYALQFVLMAGLYISKAQCGIYVTMHGYFRDYSKTLFSCLKWRRLLFTFHHTFGMVLFLSPGSC